MLQVTESAEALFRQFLERQDVTGNAIRIQPAPGPEGENTVSFQVVTQPETNDAPAESPGVDIYVAPELAEPLGEARLDAKETEKGSELFLTEQTD
jgi:Fe-S cluster assembly iron-binding protein IscA